MTSEAKQGSHAGAAARVAGDNARRDALLRVKEVPDEGSWKIPPADRHSRQVEATVGPWRGYVDVILWPFRSVVAYRASTVRFEKQRPHAPEEPSEAACKEELRARLALALGAVPGRLRYGRWLVPRDAVDLHGSYLARVVAMLGDNVRSDRAEAPDERRAREAGRL